ncbi:MAG: ATP-binding cassette domain-containing protein [Gammaproteobacteria bacterium]
MEIPQFVVQSTEKVFIKGPSGSGKTTLLGLLGGVLDAQGGEVRVLGQALADLRGGARDAFRVDHIGFIFQLFNLLPYLSVVDNVLLPCRFSARRKNRALQRSATLMDEARRLLADLGLAGAVLSAPVTALSVGQQQRVAVARALIGSPEIVIADEPTSALDADTREAFIRLLFQECREAGSALIFVSHDGALAPYFDRALAMADIALTIPTA